MISPDNPTETISNSAFLSALQQAAPSGSSLWVTSFLGSPEVTDVGNWYGAPYRSPAQVDRWNDKNAYFSVAALKPNADGEVKRRKGNFSRLLALVVDDIALEDVQGSVSWVIETSPGKTQVGILIDGADKAAADINVVDKLVTSMAERGLMGGDRAGNNSVRWVRLPVGSNLKPRTSGPWKHVVQRWNPTVLLSLEDAAGAFGIDLEQVCAERLAQPASTGLVTGAQDERLRVLTASILRGESLHDSINQIAASLVATGMPGGAVVNLLRGLMDSSMAAKDERWAARYQDIPRAVTTAEEKFSKPVRINLEVDTEPKKNRLLNLAQLDAAMRSVTWSVKHIVPQDSVGFIFGGSGTFKSFIALDYGLHVAHGMNWLGKKTKKGPVIFIAAEGGAGISRRSTAWHRQHMAVKPQDAEFYVMPHAISLATDAGSVVDDAEALGVKPVAVIIDTLAQTFDGEENSAKDVGAYLKALGHQFRERWNCVVMIVHHSGHASTERPRGSSALRANADFMFGVFRDEKQMLATLECHKVKDGELFDDYTFSLSAHHLGNDEDGDAISSLAAKAVTGEVLAEALIAESKSGRTGRNTLLLALAQNGMPEKELRSLFYEHIDAKDMDARKHAYYRAKEWSIKNGFIEVSQGTVLVLKSM